MYFSYLDYCGVLDFKNKEILRNPSILSGYGVMIVTPFQKEWDALVFKINSSERWSLMLARHMKKPSSISQIEKIIAYNLRVDTPNIKVCILNNAHIDEKMFYDLCDSIKSG